MRLTQTAWPKPIPRTYSEETSRYLAFTNAVAEANEDLYPNRCYQVCLVRRNGMFRAATLFAFRQSIGSV